MYGKKQDLYISSIEDDICKIEVYQDSQLKQIVKGVSLNDVWEHFSISKYNDIQLFGLDYAVTQQLIKQYRIPTCGRYVYKDNLDRIYSTCNELGYEVFDEIEKLLKLHINNNDLQ
ncbi:8733_t:CDS:2, partial [Racocetra persica]